MRQISFDLGRQMPEMGCDGMVTRDCWVPSQRSRKAVSVGSAFSLIFCESIG